MAEADGSAPRSALGDSVHERAKSASLVVAILTILVGADPLDIRNSSHLFRKVDYIAIAFWILALLLFLAAQALSEGTRGGSLDYGDVALPKPLSPRRLPVDSRSPPSPRKRSARQTTTTPSG